MSSPLTETAETTAAPAALTEAMIGSPGVDFQPISDGATAVLYRWPAPLAQVAVIITPKFAGRDTLVCVVISGHRRVADGIGIQTAPGAGGAGGYTPRAVCPIGAGLGQAQ